MSSGDYKGPGRKTTQRRVEERSQRYSPAGDPLRDLDDRIEREPESLEDRLAATQAHLAAALVELQALVDWFNEAPFLRAERFLFDVDRASRGAPKEDA